jgi:chromosome segregation ATPase
MKLTPLLLLLASVALPVPQAVAQTTPQPATKPTPARPAASPAVPAGERTATLSGGTGTVSRQPILTREELRACLGQEESIRLRIAEHQQARAPLDREREGIAAQQETLRAERTQVDAAASRVTSLRGRMEAHAARVSAWNRDIEAFNARPPSGPAGERERLRLNTEREALQKAQADLEAERGSITADSEKIVAAFNAKARQLDAAVADWNQRNNAWNQTGAKLEEERRGWVTGCADRRYREDDEIAIKAGR